MKNMQEYMHENMQNMKDNKQNMSFQENMTYV